MKRPDEVTEYLRCGGANCDGACNTQLDKLGVEDCVTWRVHGYVQQLEERVVHLGSLNQQNLSVITMQERTRDRLEEQISQLESRVPRWISVEERLPERDKDVLCFFRYPDSTTVCQNVYYGNGHWLGEGSFVTHWMPLPEPPEEE